MWTRRNPEEIIRWHEITRGEARSHGWGYAILCLVIVPPLVAAGWFFSFRTGMVFGQSAAGGFWMRWLICVAAMLPVARWYYRRESAKELASLLRQTVCPACGTGAENNEGTSCPCGGAFVPRSTVKWVDEEETPATSDAGSAVPAGAQ